MRISSCFKPLHRDNSRAIALVLRIFFIFYLKILPQLALAQIPNFRQHPLSFDGSQNVELTCLTHTHDGLLWIGSSKGAIAYNGIDYQIFTTDTTVSALFEDSKKRLWIGLKNGKILFLNNRNLSEWTIEEGHPSVAITGFAEDEKGRLWFSTYGEGAYLYDGRHLYNFNTQDGLTSNDIYDIIAFDNTIWLATDQGISVCSYENSQKIISKKSTDDGLPDLIVKAFFKNNSHKILCGFYDGSVSESDFLNKKTIKADGAISALSSGINGWQCIGTEDNGLFMWDGDDAIMRKIDPSVVGRKIRDLQPDDEGNIWLISDKNKLFSADLRFKIYNTILKNIQSLYIHKKKESESGKFFTVGTRNGAFEWNAKTGQSTRILPENANILSIFEDYSGNRWFGSYGTGLYMMPSGKSNILHFTEKEGLANQNIFSITSQDDTLWLATLGGISRVNFVNGKAIFHNLGVKDGLSTDFIYNIHEDQNHGFRIGTDGKGISYFDGRNFKNITHFQDKPIGAVVGIASASDKTTWLATYDGRIFYEKDAPYHFVELPMPKNRVQNISGLTINENGYVIVFKSNGLELINSKTKEILPLNTDLGFGELVDGLNVFTFDNSPKRNMGNVWFATKSGLVKMDAQVPLRPRPTMQLRGVYIFMQPIDFQSNSKFPFNQNYLTFDYEGVWLTNPMAVQYRYKVDGIDPDWKTTREQQITYSNLPTGKYTFRIQSSLTDDFTGAHEAIYKFTIEPPFWRAWWFILLSAAAIYGIVYFFIKIRETRLKREEALRHEREQAEFEMLKSQINPHFLFNSFNTLIATIETDPKAAVEYTERLSDFYRNILQVREKNTITLTEELDLLKNFFYILKKRFGEALIFDVKIKNPDKLVIPLTLQILLENAVKHNAVSRSRPLKIEIFSDDEWLIVRNNIQKKLEKEDKKGTGFGLSSLRQRYWLLNNRNVQVIHNEEIFEVKIPI